ncbi:MAG TPA: Dyp-type peroxidase [Polyangiaceae bacterium]|nr:Dyp-type peroxidase [Polyangiaceae bacterium]
MTLSSNNSVPVREAPAVALLSSRPADPARPSVPIEPVLAVNNIQGNIIGGFNKDHQTMLFLRVRRDGDVQDHLAAFKRWLHAFVPFIATAEEVLAFNRLFKAIRQRNKAETRTVQSTWINIAFSFDALSMLSPKDAELFTDQAFREGLAKRAVSTLSDPAKPEMEGNPKNWVFGGPGNEPDVVIIVASDDPDDLAATVDRIEASIYGGRSANGDSLPSGVHVVYKQQGATLPPPLTGHEHFGFLDGVSQPAIRGRLSSDPHDVLTLRQNPNDPDQGKPGQDLLWPGEFVFGYPGQKGNATEAEGGVAAKGADSLIGRGPSWAKDGSFLVVRRLRQDVPGFHAFLRDTAQSLNIGSDELGARLVGRWKSGAPVLRAPGADVPALAADDCANNNFEFQDVTAKIPPGAGGPTQCSDHTFKQSEGDKTGAICPFAGHIRKTYPRDDTGTLSNAIGEVSTQTHRLLRRGIPFGQPFFEPKDASKMPDDGNRGLVFAAYQTSIVEQFEFVQASWANNIDFKDVRVAGSVQSGHDLIIGQSNANDVRVRRCRVTVGESQIEIEAPRDWVIPTGGGYFFAPSISALGLLTA